MKKQVVKSDRKIWIALVFCMIIFIVDKSAQAVPLIYHHHVHSFNHSGCKHAIEMSASLVADAWTQSCVDDDPEYSSLGIIVNSNAKEGPMRIYENGGQTIQVRYHWWFETENSNKNAFAALLGLSRTSQEKLNITQTDLDAIRNYCAGKSDTSGITLANVTFQTLVDKFTTSWVQGSSPNRSMNLVLNLESKKVVNDLVAAHTVNFPWSKYKAYFFDTVGFNLTTSAYNRNWGGLGSYANWKTGQLYLCKRVAEYARNTDLTGLDEPLGVFANLYQLKRGWTYDGAAKWYADNDLRFDHYYYEEGRDKDRDSDIAPNGVVPGTNEPAYVDPSNPTGSYIPAKLVSLDNVYTGVGTFAQHLNATGTAGLYGAWFGWYGEDSTSSYSVDYKILRAIPNWDNLAGVPVPAYNNPQPSDQRKWNGSVYWSTNSGASADVIYSRNPINAEFYIVFKTLNGIAYLPTNSKVKEGYFTDQDFAKTGTNALSALEIVENQIRLKPEYSSRLNTGIRLTIISPPVLIIKGTSP